MVPGSLNSRDMTDPVPCESGAGIWMFLEKHLVPVRINACSIFLFSTKYLLIKTVISK
jgi:hypothetical protein